MSYSSEEGSQFSRLLWVKERGSYFLSHVAGLSAHIRDWGLWGTSLCSKQRKNMIDPSFHWSTEVSCLREMTVRELLMEIMTVLTY